MRARLTAICLLAAAGLLSHTHANADVNRCKDKNGNTLYTDSACPAGMRAISVTSFPQSCSTEDCERRRERDLEEAYERVRAEKAQLAAYTEARRTREIEDRRLEEARYEAGLRSAQAVRATPDEVVYPAYPIFGIASKCGMRCFPSHHRRMPPSRIGNIEHGHPHMKSAGMRRDVRAIGNEPRRPAAGRRAGARGEVRGRGWG